jgi:hypothetical protein
LSSDRQLKIDKETPAFAAVKTAEKESLYKQKSQTTREIYKEVRWKGVSTSSREMRKGRSAGVFSASII